MKTTLWALVLALLAAGCARHAGAPQTRLSPQRFVSVMRELSTAQPHQRAVILQKHKTSDAELRQFINAYANDPRRLAVAFDSIERYVDRNTNP